MKRVDSNLSLRPASDADLLFLFQVYASTRIDEIAPLGWTDEQVNAFMNQQFWAQHRYYHEQCPNASYDIIFKDDLAIGRLYVDRRDEELQLMDIALIPAFRGQGIGTTLLRTLLNEAAHIGRPVRLYVEN